MSTVLWMAIFGWVATAMLAGIIIGKSGFAAEQGAAPRKAEVWLPEMEPEGNFEDMDPDVVPIEGKKRGVRPVSPQWAEDTIGKGVVNLRSAYSAAGMKVSEKDLRDEVMRMLNSENGEIE